MVMFKEKGDQWSQPQKVGYEPFDLWAFDKWPTYDPRNEFIHIFYASYPYLGRAETLYYWNTEMERSEPVKVDWLDSTYGQEYHSLATEVDTLGNVHVAWHVDFDSAGSSWYRVIYANNSTGMWVKQQLSPTMQLGGFESGETELSVQSNGAAHVVYPGEPYCGLECNSFHVRNDSLNSTDWHTDTIPRPPRPLYYYGGAIIKVDVNDRIHLITGGCIQEDCVGAGKVRRFYYYKQSQDSIWVGPELILDSLFDISGVFIDRQSIPFVVEWSPYTYCHFFSDREQGFWREPYQIFDTASICYAPSSIYASRPSFVLDSQGQGHAVFAGCLRQFMGQEDSLEIYYCGPPFTSVEDSSQELEKHSFQLFQNYPNPFNSVTAIKYAVSNGPSPLIHITLKIYNILGKEVRELVNKQQSGGTYTVYWDGKNNSGKEVASGIYFYQLTVGQAHRPEQNGGRAGEHKETKKLVLIK
jgi:hypothetical protein